MEKVSGMTPMQLHLVSMLNFNRTEATEQRLKCALEQFYLAEFERMKEAELFWGAITKTWRMTKNKKKKIIFSKYILNYLVIYILFLNFAPKEQYQQNK